MIRRTVVSARNQTVRVKVTGPFGVALQFIPVLQQYCLVSVGNERFLFCSSYLVGGATTLARIRRHLASDVPVKATIVSSASIAALGIGTIRAILKRARHRLFSVTPLVTSLVEHAHGKRAADSLGAHASDRSVLLPRMKSLFLRAIPAPFTAFGHIGSFSQSFPRRSL